MPTSHDTPFFDHAANYTGHEVQAPRPLHEPGNVVDALLRLAVNPKDEEIVDADGFVKILLDGIAPPPTHLTRNERERREARPMTPASP